MPKDNTMITMTYNTHANMPCKLVTYTIDLSLKIFLNEMS